VAALKPCKEGFRFLKALLLESTFSFASEVFGYELEHVYFALFWFDIVDNEVIS